LLAGRVDVVAVCAGGRLVGVVIFWLHQEKEIDKMASAKRNHYRQTARCSGVFVQTEVGRFFGRIRLEETL
jgi:hypothetical protein